MSKTKTIGLCIGGGGAKGVASLGIIEALLKEGVEISAISGTSVGAIIGAYFALHGEVTSLKETLFKISKREWFSMLDPSVRSKNALFKGNKFHKLYLEMFGDTTFEDLNIPLILTATNLQAGSVSYLNSGKLLDAVLASSSYPGLFPPHLIEGKPHVDGGLLDNLPYEILLEKGMDKVIGINLLSHTANLKTEYNTISSVFTRSLDLMMGNAFKQNPPPAKEVYMFSPKFSGRVSSTIGVTNLQDKYEVGQKEYLRVEKDFLNWLA